MASSQGTPAYEQLSVILAVFILSTRAREDDMHGRCHRRVAPALPLMLHAWRSLEPAPNVIGSIDLLLTSQRLYHH